MKKEIKINFLHQGGDYDKENNFFTNLLRKKYNVKISDKPDYVFFSVYSTLNKSFSNDLKNEEIKKGGLKKLLKPLLKKEFVKDFIWFLVSKKIIGKSKIPEIRGDFKKIFFTHENVVPDMKKCDWAFSFCYEDEFKHPKHMRIPYYFVALEGESLKKNKIDFKEIKKEKTEFCNFIYKAHFPLRIKFFKKLSKYKKVHSPGSCMNNFPAIGNFKDPNDQRASKDCYKDKQLFLKKYKFTIAFENTSYSGYTTEKLVHPMLANSIPIYWGNPNVGRDFNKKSFINVKDFKDFNAVIKRIKEIDKDDKLYKKILNEPWLNENSPNKWMNEGQILKRMRDIFG